MSGKGLLGHTRRQRFLRAAGICDGVLILGMMVFWFAFGRSILGVDKNPMVTVYYWPICFLLIVLWFILVVLDMKEGLRDIADDQD